MVTSFPAYATSIAAVLVEYGDATPASEACAAFSNLLALVFDDDNTQHAAFHNTISSKPKRERATIIPH
jgi:hypothetical protein